MKTILFLAHLDSGQEDRLRVALDLCRAVDGHLACLDLYTLPEGYGEMHGVTPTALLIDEAEADAANRAGLEARLGEEGVDWSWTDAAGTFERRVIAAARLCDVIVESSRFEQSEKPGDRAIIGDLIQRSGRPVLAVPPETKGIDLGGRVLVAWDGSPRAIESLRAAVPLLARAAEVRIIEVGEAEREHEAAAALLYLAHRRIAGAIQTVETGESIAQTIIDEATGGNAAYVVMGGYGHSRLGEALFGGVTRDMLAYCPVPMLIAH